MSFVDVYQHRLHQFIRNTARELYLQITPQMVMDFGRIITRFTPSSSETVDTNVGLASDAIFNRFVEYAINIPQRDSITRARAPTPRAPTPRTPTPRTPTPMPPPGFEQVGTPAPDFGYSHEPEDPPVIGKGRSSVVNNPAFATKEFPENYPEDAVDILKAMSFGNGLKLLGSMSLRSQRYSGDYDGYEVVSKEGARSKVLKEFATKFQKIVRHLQSMKNVWIGDIKAGCVDEWRVIPRTAMIKEGRVVGWNYVHSKKLLEQLKSQKIISPEEFAKASATLKERPTTKDYFNARDANKFHILRWKPKDVLANRLTLRDGEHITLEEAFQTPSITKMDVIGLVQGNRFTDFSVIYEFRDGKTVLNPDPIDIVDSLKADILYYSSVGKYFKAIKRKFALAKYEQDVSVVEKLTPVLNSDLGLLYHVVGDIGTLTNLLKQPNVPLDEVRFEIDQFIGRLSNIYTLKGFLRDEPRIVAEIKRVLGLSQKAMIPALEKLEETLNNHLQDNAKPVWKSL